MSVLWPFWEKECCLQKLKENKKFLRSSSVEIQGQILRASGDRVKAQGQRQNAEGGLEKNPSPIYVALGTNTNTSSMGGEIDMEQIQPFLYVILALGLAVGISYAWDYVVKKLKKE